MAQAEMRRVRLCWKPYFCLHERMNEGRPHLGGRLRKPAKGTPSLRSPRFHRKKPLKDDPGDPCPSTSLIPPQGHRRLREDLHRVRPISVQNTRRESGESPTRARSAFPSVTDACRFLADGSRAGVMSAFALAGASRSGSGRAVEGAGSFDAGSISLPDVRYMFFL